MTRMRQVLLLLAGLALTAGACEKRRDPERTEASNQALRRTLVQMGQEDQAEIRQSFRQENVPSRRRQRQALLQQILAEHGWPRLSQVGPEGASGAWIVAQHADDDLAFQRRCLGHLEQAFAQGEAPGPHLAYLTDRVLSNEGKPQRYGTQGGPVYTDAERAEVDARRQQMGLPPMAETAAHRIRIYEEVYHQDAGRP